MKKVLLRYYPTNNLGDDLFVKVITERYKNYFSIILRLNNYCFSHIDNLKVYKSFFCHIFFRFSETIFRKAGIWQNILSKRNNLLLYLGGSIFIEGDNIIKWKKEKYMYSKLSIPYYILGANVGPYKSEKFINILKVIFKNAKDVCFRDNSSYGLFKDSNINSIRQSTDIVFSLKTSKYNNKNDNTAIISIIDCNNHFNKTTTDKYDQEIINLTKKLVQDNYGVIYMSFCKYEGDEIAIKRIVDKLDTNLANKIEIYNYNGDLEKALSLIAKCKIVVASRFHAAILGLLFSKKVLPLAYSNKTINILQDLGFKGDIVDINSIDKFNGNNFDFDRLQLNNVDEQIILSESQFQELDKVLVRREKYEQKK